ncbi:Calponin-like actin-binding domain containing protein [Dorcoceras hygrometricum]|uniref:Calponin-like actin-binding domain containing protein n=1 Tax=Dorcoceras hygrometricum TaxID=472368 RepID=A0A2Z7AQ08_9LAMI|nr:Calponin-like actin-binding domain containing protein [Dorcoceras hygrometricum]
MDNEKRVFDVFKRPTTTDNGSESIGSVCGEATLMLKSGREIVQKDSKRENICKLVAGEEVNECGRKHICAQISGRRIYSADGSHYKFSNWFDVHGSAVELAMETSRVVSAMKQSVSEEATSYGDSADGLEVDDVISDVIQSQESAGSLHSRRKMKRRRRGDPVASYSAINRCYLKIAKRCRLHKLIRQRFALAIKNSAGRLCVVISADEATVHPVAKIFSRKMISRRKQQYFQSRAYLYQLLLRFQSL